MDMAQTSPNGGEPARLGRFFWASLAVLGIVILAAVVTFVGRHHRPTADPGLGFADSGAPDPVPDAKIAIGGTLYYLKAGDKTSQLWSWRTGGEGKSVYSVNGRWMFDTAGLSADGRFLAYVSDRAELVVRDLSAGTERVVVAGLALGEQVCQDAVWAPDGKPMVLTQNGVDASGAPKLQWFDVTTGAAASTAVKVGGCFARPVARTDGGYDLYYLSKGDVYWQTPDGNAAATGLGPAVSDTVGEPVRALGGVSPDGKKVCVLTGDGGPLKKRALDCSVIADIATTRVEPLKDVPDSGVRGPVLFMPDGRRVARFSNFVSLRGLDGIPTGTEPEPESIKDLWLLAYVS
ncbi:hypothetical protein Afil01_11050 [Actinorhabdospora filicis]|uniref:WD40 repeat protein n=2 Tax=Actinorhabdospora filicis TaxID=1785913 RepID=A0A9W6W7U8_9ACTN|nr:hypothetical protein Afil01_11050 [Actinorhabdospora filicis]